MELCDKSPFAKGGFRGNVNMVAAAKKWRALALHYLFIRNHRTILQVPPRLQQPPRLEPE